MSPLTTPVAPAPVAAPTVDSPWLVADIGGTNARFGVVTETGGRAHRATTLRTDAYPDLTEAVTAYLELTDTPRPSAVCAAVAGPVAGDTFRLTNGSWTLSIEDTRRRLGVGALHLMNDFEALAMSLPALTDDDLVFIGDARPRPNHAKAVLGPGTGLGVAGLVPTGPGRHVALPTEGGHVLLRPAHGPDTEVLAALHDELGNIGTVITAEHVLSGPGLGRLHRAVAVVHGVQALPLSPADISARALAADDPLCTETVEVFCRLLGTFAAGVALTMGARGGIYLAGGILPRITDLLLEGHFREGFENNPSMAAYLHRISTALVTAPAPALDGAAAWLTAQLDQGVTA